MTLNRRAFVRVLSSVLLVAADLVSNLSGKGYNITFPGQNDFASASQSYNLRYNYKPAVVTYPTTTQQIAEIVKIGAREGFKIAARSGGHSYVAGGLGGKDGSIVIDLKNFNSITYDSQKKTAVIGTGNRLGNIIVALNNKGRAIPHGTCPYVGWGGHATFGGFGFTSRLWGMAVDSVIAAEVVLANGTIVQASKDRNPDLFWAIRGGGGSFGIVTSTTVKTYPAPSSATIFQSNYQLTIEAATKALDSFQRFAASNIPATLGIEVTLGSGAPKGKIVFEVMGGWYGPSSDLDSVIRPFISTLPAPLWSKRTVGTYLDSTRTLAGGSLDISAPDKRDTFYAKSLITPKNPPMDEKTRRAFITYLANQEGLPVKWFIQLGLIGGSNSAVNRIPADENAFAHRNGLLEIQFYAYSSNNKPPFPTAGFAFLDGAVNSIIKNSPPGWNYGAYANYPDDRLQNASSFYYKAHLPRLKSLKVQLDPTSVFSSPIRISP